ncbi:MAG: alpha/beta hydrolase [Lachnospiraceae bacterium]|nr:alpha/beta hydrolase [Lachnospiraceae bacterium]
MILKRDFIYTPVDKNRPLHIYLPDDYADTDERYPVMYFFDGHNLFTDEDATYGKCWGLKDFLDTWGKKMIVVGIECGHEGEERLSEYLPYPTVGKFLKNHTVMGGKTFEWIIQEIKPMIDREYRTYPFRKCTGIAGSSMGGLMAVYGIVHHNEYFSKAACISSAIGFCMPALMKDMKANHMNPDTRVYLSWGTNEAYGLTDQSKEDTTSRTYQWNHRVAKSVWESGATAKLYSQVGGGHCEADWEKLVPGFMEFLWME